MKILSLSLDKSILDKSSAVAQRTLEYGRLVDKYWVLVSADKNTVINLSEQVRVLGVAGNNKLLKLFRIYRLGKKLLTDENFDIITVQDQYYLGLAGLWLSQKFNKGLELQIHGWEKFHGLRVPIAKYVISHAQAIRAVSQRLKKQLVHDFGVSEQKISVVPIYNEIKNHISPASPSEAGRAKIKNIDKFIFLTVGRLVPIKNIGLQIEAMAWIVKKYPEAKLWIVGDGPERDNLKFKVESLKLDVNVKFYGWQDSLKNFYGQADVFLLTSNYEGWGLAVVEAANYGLPIIMTDVGCAGELIKDEESGLVIPINDQFRLQDSMAKLMEQPELRKELGESAKYAVLELPSLEETLRRYKESWQIALNMKK